MPTISKQIVTGVTREKLTLLDNYVARKESERDRAEPALPADAYSANLDYEQGEEFISRLASLPTGQTDASRYQRLVLEILNYLFMPQLTDGQLEVETYQGTERRDIIFLNEADSSFWSYVRNNYKSPFVMFEIKNTQEVELEHVNQAAAYLGVRLGLLGFIVTRSVPKDNIIRKTYAIFNDTPGDTRKVVLILSDSDLVAMIREKQEDRLPAKYVQNVYRTFRQRVQ